MITILAWIIVVYNTILLTAAIVPVLLGGLADDHPDYPLPEKQRKRYLRPLGLAIDFCAFVLAILVLL
jgi:hypothetical protein